MTQHNYGDQNQRDQQRQNGVPQSERWLADNEHGSRDKNFGAGGREFEAGSGPRRYSEEQQYGEEGNDACYGEGRRSQAYQGAKTKRGFPQEAYEQDYQFGSGRSDHMQGRGPRDPYDQAYRGGQYPQGQQGAASQIGRQDQERQRYYNTQRAPYGNESAYSRQQYGQGMQNDWYDQQGMGQQGSSNRYQSGQRDFGGNYDRDQFGNTFQNAHQQDFRQGGSGQASYSSHSQHHDPHYNQWRNEQIRRLDDDYNTWKEERYGKFSDEFDEWRRNRDANRHTSHQEHSAGTGARSSGANDHDKNQGGHESMSQKGQGSNASQGNDQDNGRGKSKPN